jgi:hypothetical protein
MPRPPPLPAQPGSGKGPLDYLKYAISLCFIFAGLFALGSLVFAVEILLGHESDPFVPIFGGCYAALTAFAGMMLHRRKKIGKVLAIVCFALMLPGCPVGTVLGILGISWTRKASPTLN